MMHESGYYFFAKLVGEKTWYPTHAQTTLVINRKGMATGLKRLPALVGRLPKALARNELHEAVRTGQTPSGRWAISMYKVSDKNRKPLYCFTDYITVHAAGRSVDFRSAVSTMKNSYKQRLIAKSQRLENALKETRERLQRWDNSGTLVLYHEEDKIQTLLEEYQKEMKSFRSALTVMTEVEREIKGSGAEPAVTSAGGTSVLTSWK